MTGPVSSPWSIVTRRDVIDVTSSTPVADEHWTFVDAAGHEHRWDGARLHTLEWVVDGTYWCEDCQDSHQEGHYQCSRCGERVAPGYREPDPWPTYLAGRTSYTLVYDDGQDKRQYAFSAEDLGVLRARWADERDAVATEVAERSVLISAEAHYPG